MQDAKSRQKSPSGNHRKTLSGYIFATKARIANRKKLLSSDMSSTRFHNMAFSSGRQPNFAALNRGRHLCSAGRPPRWTLAHILVLSFSLCMIIFIHRNHKTSSKYKRKIEKTRMWANAQRDGRPAEYRWRPQFNAATFG